jgi:hypothetical protein
MIAGIRVEILNVAIARVGLNGKVLVSTLQLNIIVTLGPI